MNLDPEGMGVTPEDFVSPTSREERLSAEYHRAADVLETKVRATKLITAMALTDVVVTSPAILDKPILCSIGIISSITGTAGTLAYNSLVKSKRDLANEGPQPDKR